MAVPRPTECGMVPSAAATRRCGGPRSRVLTFHFGWTQWPRATAVRPHGRAPADRARNGAVGRRDATVRTLIPERRGDPEPIDQAPREACRPTRGGAAS